MKDKKEINTNDLWLKQYKENYSGKSPEAKEIEGFLKETYNGANYIPWATMERLTYMQDPNAEFTPILTENNYLVHTDRFVNVNVAESADKVNRTEALVVSHFVKVACTFLGKTFVEEYPIQEQDYSAAKIYNQNLVNKALKRALAKVASRATGLGLKLYESKDLQFDEKEDKKPEIKTSTPTKTKKAEEVKVETTSTTEEPIKVDLKAANITSTPVQVASTVTAVPAENITYTSDVVNLCNLIKTANPEKMTKVLQNLNVPILKQHGFTLNQEDSNEVLCEKLSHFQDVNVFTKAINNMLG